MEQNNFLIAYHERLSDVIEELESLQDHESFDRLLEATAVERTTSLDFDTDTYLHVLRQDLPTALSEKLFFSQRLWIHDTHAQLTELPESERRDGTKDWTLTINFSTTSNPQQDPVGSKFTIISTPLETVCTTVNLNGDQLTYRADAFVGQKLLLTMLSSAVAAENGGDETVYKDFKASEERSPLSTKIMGASLLSLGQRFGKSQKTVLSYMPHPEYGDRAVAVRVSEEEELGANKRTLDFYMNTQIGSGSIDAKHTAMLSLRYEDIRHDGIVLSALDQQYGKRFPTDIPIDDMQFAVRMGMFDHSQKYCFDPNQDREQYGLIAETIMTVLRPCLEQYLDYDRVDTIDIDSEE